jgi:hypothetical protein
LFLEVLFYRVPVDGPYLPFPTIFNVREWERLDYHGRTILGTDQNYFHKITGPIFTPPQHAPFGDPDLWQNGWSYAKWIAGDYPGADCSCWRMSGGGQGGGNWFQNCCQDTFQTAPELYGVWLSSTGFYDLTPTSFVMPAYDFPPNGFQGPTFTSAEPPYLSFNIGIACDQTLGFVFPYFGFVPPYAVIPGTEIVVQCDPLTIQFSIGWWNGGSYTLIGTVFMAAVPILAMLYGGQGGNAWKWHLTLQMASGGEGGYPTYTPFPPVFFMGQGGQGGGSPGWAFPPVFFMGQGGQGGGSFTITP